MESPSLNSGERGTAHQSATSAPTQVGELIDAEGQNRGVVEIAEAQQLADEASLDLVEIVPNAEPPVCKILDFGKFRFLEQKKSAEARKKQKVVEIKEIKASSRASTTTITK